MTDGPDAPTSARYRFDALVAAEAETPADGQGPEADENRAVVRRYFEMWNSGDASVADSLLAATYFDHAHPEVIGRAALRALVPRFRRANPDARLSIEIVAANATLVAVRNTVTRTVHRTVTSSEGIAVFRIDAGRIVEQWSSYPDAEFSSPDATRASMETWLSFRA